MNQLLQVYLNNIQHNRATGDTCEQAFRPLLEHLLHQFDPQLTLINDPGLIACGTPDYIILANNKPSGYIETTDLGANLDEIVETEQSARYRRFLHNLILTNYLDFYWYVGGELVDMVNLEWVDGDIIQTNDNEAEALWTLLASFCHQDIESNIVPTPERVDSVIIADDPSIPSISHDGDPAFLDDLIEKSGLFSARVKNTLVRRGVITPRLLLMNTPELLLQDIRNLGLKGLAEIEETLAEQGWYLPETTTTRLTILYRLLTVAFYKTGYSLRLSRLTELVNKASLNKVWTEAEVAEGVAGHPYISESEFENGRYIFNVHPVGTPVHLPSEEPEPVETDDGKLLLAYVWKCWFANLKQNEQEVLGLRYGLNGDEPLTLEETGQLQGLTRERIRQIEKSGLSKLGATKKRVYWEALANLLAEGLEAASGLLSPTAWERLLDEKAIWEEEESRPLLLSLLCAVLDDFHYLNSFERATYAQIRTSHIHQLESALKKVLRQYKAEGLLLNQLAEETQQQLTDDFPVEAASPQFIAAACDLFERVGPKENGRYYYFKKKKQSIYPDVDSGWAGKPGTRLHEWELRLRGLFAKSAWIGQLPLTEADYQELCQAIQEEALEPHYFTREMAGQPRLVPPAVFITTMVLTARYAELLPDEVIDEFWNPYLRHIWNVTYTQAFMARCRKRFVQVVPYLEATFGFVFPRLSTGDVVTPIFRHALIPRYMQPDFADWLRKNWRDILAVAETPTLLATNLKEDKSLDHYYSHRLKHFITGKATAETAAALIGNMAEAINLYINEGESIESISHLLADSPIEQELWQGLAQVFADEQETSPASLRLSKPRLTWVWSVDDDEMHLRVQNIILSADNHLEGEPNRVAWLAEGEADPLAAEIEVEVSPWRMQSGERIVNDLFLPEPDGPLAGQLVLLTDMDETAVSLPIPSLPNSNVQFFRLTQQGAYGIPVDSTEVNDGVWLVCGQRPLTFLDDDDEQIEPDWEPSVPYPLTDSYQWAAQFTLNLPISIQQEGKKLLALTENRSQPAIGNASLTGTQLIPSLSSQVQPTFADAHITLSIEYGGEQLLKQASLWLRGQDGWRKQWPLVQLREQGVARLDDDQLTIELVSLLPSQPNFYTLELRFSLQPVYAAPLQFALVPGLHVLPPDAEPLYTPVHPPHVLLEGVDEGIVVRREGMTVTTELDGTQRIVWTDLKHDPRLVLRFDNVDVPLAWHVSRFMAWLEPKPNKPFLTIGELPTTILHAVGTKTAVTEFRLFIPGERYRQVSLHNGRYAMQIGQSQLVDMLRLAEGQHTVLKIQAGADAWTLLEVRKRPELTAVHVEYDEAERMLLCSTGLLEAWPGNGRFVAESLTNPFAPQTQLGRITELKEVHLLSADLPDGDYLLRLELDGAWLPMPETAVCFTVGTPDDGEYPLALLQEIRSSRLVSPHLAEDFVLWWAEIAEQGQTGLTPQTLFQLASVSATALENFAVPHLQKLWSPLTVLKMVHNQSQWQEEHGLLPAWILLAHPIILKTAGHGFGLKLFPIQLLQGGLRGMGYGRWRLGSDEEAPKELVYVQWRPLSGQTVHVEAGLPEDVPNRDWTGVDLYDCYGLHYCLRCGRLTGVKANSLPDEIREEHLHGRQSVDLYDITMPIAHNGYQLECEVVPERRGSFLLDVYEEFGIPLPLAEAYLPEPPLPRRNPIDSGELLVSQWLGVIREIKRMGINNERWPFWSSATRLFTMWQRQETVSQLGQISLALGLLLRCAAYQTSQFYKLLNDANLTEQDCQTTLAQLNRISPEHVQWGLTWAELLILHSPKGN